MKKNINTDVDNTAIEDNKLLGTLRTSLPFDVSKNSFDLMFFGTGRGILTFLVAVCQQVGLQTLTAGKASFINGLFVVITPVIEHFLPCYKAPIPTVTWVAIVFAVFGMYYLAYPNGVTESTLETESEDIPIGVGWLLMSTVFNSLDIVWSDVGAKRVDTVDFTLVMFAMCTLIGVVVAFFVEPSDWTWPLAALRHGWPLVVFVGITEGFGYTFGSIGQMYVPCHRASLLYGLEGVCTCILGFMLIGEVLTYRELFGCLLLMAGTIVSSSSPETDHGHVGHVARNSDLIQADDLEGSKCLSTTTTNSKYGTI